MKKKKLWGVFLAGVLAVALTGCGGDVPVEEVTTESKDVVESVVETKESEAEISEGFIVPTSQYDGLAEGFKTITYEGLVFDIPSHFSESATTEGMWESGLGANVNIQVIPDGAAMIPAVTVDMYLDPVKEALREAFQQDDLEVLNTYDAHFKVYDEDAFAYDMAYSIAVEGITIDISQTQILVAVGDDARILTFSFTSLDAENSEALLHTIETLRFE